MKKLPIYLLLLFVSFSCKNEKQSIDEIQSNNNSESNSEIATQKPKKSVANTSSIFRSDSFYENIDSEWLRVEFDENSNIAKIFYWSDANNKKQELKFHAELFKSTENFKGELILPSNNVNLSFTLINEVFTITHQDQIQQKFLLESKGIETNPSK